MTDAIRSRGSWTKAKRDYLERVLAVLEELREQGFEDSIAVELDALPPAALETLVRDSILAHLDRDRLDEDQTRELEDQARIERLRARVLDVVGDVAP